MITDSSKLYFCFHSNMSPPKVKLADLLGKKAETKVEQKVEKKEEKVLLMDKLKTKEYKIQMKEAEIEERE